ncbi:hypothetical protein SAMN02745117_01038 [Lampropedia hyalina DSM 16112]|jgi:tRNA U54 and U55 pseudouridine synthase Pus10|uniref:Uncharacterized protein n=1 Tax=Lampropedia hyalina DSM 16112 TaxID=1122156 RepID=A0A1M4XE75_9BURK|nr:hypothetical protein [Lampropedia hyalina]SHE91814.1 hypothetical protein SAMN02745117_01038 [Lampropedia hyalina DSM 16112]
MNTYFFENSRQFLERLIQDDPSNTSLVQAYTRLIEKYADLEISQFEQNTSFNKDFNKNQTEITKNQQTTQSEIIKKQVEKGVMPAQSSLQQLGL